MAIDTNGIVQIITALGTFSTVIIGGVIAIKQIGLGKKVEDAKNAQQTFATDRANQIADLKDTVVKKVTEVQETMKGTGP